MRFTAPTDKDFNVKLKPLLTDPAYPGTLQWQAVPPESKPAWLTIDSARNEMYGRPKMDHLGVATFTLFVKEAGTENADSTRVEITVIAPPEWKENPLNLGFQNEREEMAQIDLKTKINNPPPGLTFSWENEKPEWMNISPGGIITGTPKRPHVGPYGDKDSDRFMIVATGPGGGARVRAYGKVILVLQPPKWQAAQFPLPDAPEDDAYEQPQSGKVINPEGASLTFSKVSGPDWVSVSPSGVIYGTPKKKDISDNVAIVVKFVGKLGTTTFPDESAKFTVKVLHVNHCPEIANVTLPPAYTKKAYPAQQLKATDYDDDSLKFEISSFGGPGADWARLTPDGKFTGTPDKPNMGADSWLVSVSDGQCNRQAMVKVTVIKSNEPPVCTTGIAFLPDAKEDFDYAENLNQPKYVVDPDPGDTLTFTLIRPRNRNNWARVSSAGIFSGKPDKTDVGPLTYDIKVEDGVSGSVVCAFNITVQHTNHDPKWKLDPYFQAKEENPLPDSVNVKDYVEDSDGDTLIFKKVSGPAWVQVASNGQLTGLPPDPGIFTVVVAADDQQGGMINGTVTLEVIAVNHAPRWTSDPIILPDVDEDKSANASLAEYAEDPDPGDTLTFRKAPNGGTCPAWIQVKSDGTVTGVPRRPNDIGINRCKVRVLDKESLFAEAQLQITVKKVNRQPKWQQDPIKLPPAYEEKDFSFSFLVPEQYAIDDDNDALTFSKKDGPAWLKISPQGVASGKPEKADVITEFKAVFEVTDNLSQPVPVNVVGEVIHVNHPPKINSEAWSMIIKEREIVTVNLLDSVTDPDGDPLNCDLRGQPSFATRAQCVLTLKPKHEDLGGNQFKDYQFTVVVDDFQLSAEGPFKVRVVRDPQLPVCRDLAFEAKTGQPFSASIEGACTDKDGMPITYPEMTGPEWLKLSGATISGTAADQHLGENIFTVSGKNDALITKFKVTIKVVPGIETDRFTLGTEAGPAENLWIVDASHCNKVLRRLLTDNIHWYYEAIRGASVALTGTYLSADAQRDDGLPVQVGVGPYIIFGSGQAAIDDFNQRTVVASEGKNCCNSPIWSMFRFYQRVPGIPEIYHNQYMMERVPMDALIITNQRDHYRFYAKNTPQAKWTAADYAQNFIEFHQKEKKLYRVSAIVPPCTRLIETLPEEQWHGSEGAYKTLVDKTGGLYFPTQGGCDLDNKKMRKIMEDYAAFVIDRAKVHGKSRYQLTKPPNETSSMKVSVNNVLIPGNTGGETDKWYYDNATNEVVFRWYLIDVGQLKSGLPIVIEYRISRLGSRKQPF